MSLFGALQSAVTGLNAQSTAIATISDNVANSSTVGYKTTSASFATLVTGASNATSYSSNGVTSSAVQNVAQQGEISSTSSTTDLAIDGNGFFVVAQSADSSELYFTRAGSFSTDAEGYLINTSGYYLMGYPLNADGSLANGSSTSDLEAINVLSISGTAEATSSIDLDLNLPADAETGDSFEVTTEIYDSLGVGHELTLNWEKTGENEWSLSIADPTASDGTTSEGTVGSGEFTVTFNSDGTLASVSSTELSVSGWTSGAADSAIALNFGTVGRADGITQYASGDDEPAIDVTAIDANGMEYGEFTSVEIGDDGIVTAYFDNGTSRAIYQVPIATFANPDGLTAVSGNAYAMSEESGNYLLKTPGFGGAGDIVASALESSTVDIADEFSRMIVAQQAYSAASQVISTADEMMSTLISTLR